MSSSPSAVELGLEKAGLVRKSVPVETKDFAILQDVERRMSRFDARQGAFSYSWKRAATEQSAEVRVLWENHLGGICTIIVRIKEGRFGEELPRTDAEVVHRLCGK